MAALDFPSSPTVGQKYPTTPVSGVPVYTWDGEKWTTSGGAIGSTGGADDPPPMDGISAAGSSTQWAREDHVHPTDTTRAPITSPTFLISAYAPTPTAGDASTSVATTAFVTTAVGAPSTPYVRYDAAQTLTSPQQAQARSNIAVTSARRKRHYQWRFPRKSGRLCFRCRVEPPEHMATINGRRVQAAVIILSPNSRAARKSPSRPASRLFNQSRTPMLSVVLMC